MTPWFLTATGFGGRCARCGSRRWGCSRVGPSARRSLAGCRPRALPTRASSAAEMCAPTFTPHTPTPPPCKHSHWKGAVRGWGLPEPWVICCRDVRSHFHILHPDPCTCKPLQPHPAHFDQTKNPRSKGGTFQTLSNSETSLMPRRFISCRASFPVKKRALYDCRLI